MRWFFVLCFLMLLSTPAFAQEMETTVIDPPKGVVGYDGIQCVGEATQGGYSHRIVTYVGADAGEMSSNPDRERAWQIDQCRSDLELMMGFWFGRRGVTFDPGNLKVTTRRV